MPSLVEFPIMIDSYIISLDIVKVQLTSEQNYLGTKLFSLSVSVNSVISTVILCDQVTESDIITLLVSDTVTD